MKDGDFIVVDAGPDLDYYDIDITTSFPANGKFTPRQREVYEASLAVHEANLQVYRPGLTLEQCRKEVEEILKKRGFDLDEGLLQADAGRVRPLRRHGHARRRRQPAGAEGRDGLRQRALHVWPGEDLGVRVEDTILITETGCENLTPGIPRTVPEIEAAMRAAKQ